MANLASRLGLNREALTQSVRTAVATALSLLLARALKLPEFYWAPISTIVILLSTIDPLTLAWQGFVGTAVGAALGAVIATGFSSNGIVYGTGILVCGIISAMQRMAIAYRFAAITLSIVLLIAPAEPPWVVALDRFVEVSLGIGVALVVALVWRVQQLNQELRDPMFPTLWNFPIPKTAAALAIGLSVLALAAVCHLRPPFWLLPRNKYRSKNRPKRPQNWHGKFDRSGCLTHLRWGDHIYSSEDIGNAE